MAVAPERARASTRGRASRRRSRRSCDVPQELRDTGDVLEVNFGPNHPSTHGVLRLIVDLHGETVVGLEAVIGYLHTGFEKNMEQKTWWKAITYPQRIDYVSFQNNELVFVLAIEKLLGIEVPREGDVDADAALRAEPDPLAPRLARHVRARARRDLDVLVLLPRARADPRPVRARHRLRACTRATSRPAGSPRTSRAASIPSAASSSSWMPRAVDDYERLVDQNQIWLERTRGIGLLSAEDAIALGQSGPGAARVGRRLGPAARRAVPRVRPGRLRRPRLPARRRLRPLPRAHGRDARVDADRRAVPRPARGHGGRAVDRRRPQGRAAAARGAPHVDGVADPPLQDRHRGLPRARGRGLRRRSSRRAASSAATSSPTAARSRGA